MIGGKWKNRTQNISKDYCVFSVPVFTVGNYFPPLTAHMAPTAWKVETRQLGTRIPIRSENVNLLPNVGSYCAQVQNISAV